MKWINPQTKAPPFHKLLLLELMDGTITAGYLMISKRDMQQDQTTYLFQYLTPERTFQETVTPVRFYCVPSRPKPKKKIVAKNINYNQEPTMLSDDELSDNFLDVPPQGKN